MLFRMHRDEALDDAVGFSNRMATGETLTSIAVSVWDGATEVSGGNGFTISGVAASTAIETDEDGVAHPIGQAVVYTITGENTLAAKDYDLKVEATIVQTSEKLIGQDAHGFPPKIRVKAWGEA